MKADPEGGCRHQCEGILGSSGRLQSQSGLGVCVDHQTRRSAKCWSPGLHSMGHIPSANLLRFRDRVDMSKIGDPAKLAVIVGTGYGYEREDGVASSPSPTWVCTEGLLILAI
jgi:hypothetical protein